MDLWRRSAMVLVGLAILAVYTAVAVVGFVWLG